MSDVEARIRDWCRRIARSVRWQRTPFDASEIDQLEQYFLEVSLTSVPYNSESREQGLIWVCGALEYLHESICGPNNDDPEAWFFHSMMALTNIACPTGMIRTDEGAHFLSRMREGLDEMDSTS
ncbi:MAG: hypothetical protein P1U64_05725 [Alcanivoracaceae bacterium]|nr:hypothetical protein [Alcanivoracaceae bacterium]